MNAPRPPRPETSAATPSGKSPRALFEGRPVNSAAALLLLLLLFAPCAARAQAEPQKAQGAGETAAAAAPQPTPARPARTELSGRVLGESGEPVADVPVVLVPRTSGLRFGPGSTRTAVADESGGFRFEGLDPGLYEVSARVPGFVPETDPLTGQPLGPHRPGDNVTVRLVKGGVVTGTVTDGQGQPLVSLNVRAVRVRDLDGGTPPFPFPSSAEDRTDDRGVYRIYGLRPGLYVVYAGGYGNAPFPFFAGQGEAATFYPSGTRDTAAEVPVRSGQEAGGIDIRLREDPARRVTGTVDSPAGALGEFGVGVNLMYASTAMPAGTYFVNTAMSPGDRSFSFEGVGDGEYDLQATVNGREGVTLASAPQRVSVRGADVTGIKLTLAPLASASGTLRFEPAAEAGRPDACKNVRATQLPQETLVTVAPVAPQGATPGRVFSRLRVPQSAAPDGAGAFTVRSLEAGRYRLSARLFDEALYVRSIQTPAPPTPQRAAGAGPQRAAAATTPAAAVSRDTFDVKAGQQFSGLVVRVAEGAASFAGSVAAADPAAGVPPPFSQLRVHLVPQERERAEETLHYYEAPVAADGAFAFKNLAPGRYLVVARPFLVEPGEGAPRPAALDANARALLRREAESANTAVELQPCQRTADFVLRFPAK